MDGRVMIPIYVDPTLSEIDAVHAMTDVTREQVIDVWKALVRFNTDPQSEVKP